MVLRKIDRIFLTEDRIEFFGKIFGVARAESKRDDCSDVAEYSNSKLFINLLNIGINKNRGAAMISNRCRSPTR